MTRPPRKAGEETGELTRHGDFADFDKTRKVGDNAAPGTAPAALFPDLFRQPSSVVWNSLRTPAGGPLARQLWSAAIRQVRGRKRKAREDGKGRAGAHAAVAATADDAGPDAGG
jgi:hypothetical protein